MKKYIKLALLIIGAIIVLVIVFLPSIIRAMGLRSNYKGEVFELRGKKVLIITTSHDRLDPTDKATGVYASEMTVPYFQFSDAKMAVDLASIKGGKIPIEPRSLKWPLLTEEDKRYLNDSVFLRKSENSLKIDSVDFAKYDIIFLAGGWGAAYDLGTSDILGKKISEAVALGIPLGSVCHGALGFLKVINANGEPFVKGKHMTGVTNKQIRELGIEITPLHPETELKKAGAIYESASAFRDIFADLTVVDGNLVTGQNQNAGKETAQKLMKLVVQKEHE